MLDLEFAELSDTGPIREHNEDCCGHVVPATPEAAQSRGWCFAIADGVGGQAGGEIASRLAIETILYRLPSVSVAESLTVALPRIIQAANQRVFEAAADVVEKGRRAGSIATTIVACAIRNDRATVAHVGDSRCYLVRRGEVSQLTPDHTVANEQRRLGILTSRQAASAHTTNLLSRSLGNEMAVDIDTSDHLLTTGDVLVLCTDGLYRSVTPRDMAASVSPKRDLKEAAELLVSLANARDGSDNVSVQIIRIKTVESVGMYRGRLYKLPESAARMNELHAGDQLDQYRLEELVARSGMASIFKATDLRDGRTVAIKVPHPEMEADPLFYDRFLREADIGQKLDHPGVMKVITPAPDDEPSRVYMVMEWVDGRLLRNILSEETKLPPERAVHLTGEILKALDYIHQHGVLHRDLKPENIMVGANDAIKLIDFGLAGQGGARRLTFGKLTQVMGTPNYISPEQVKGKRGDQRTDIYSVGVMLYEMLTGKCPFDGPNPFAIMNERLLKDPVPPRELNPDISRELQETIYRAMEREPQKRYPTAREFAHDLAHPEDVGIADREELINWRNRREHWQRNAMLYIGLALIPIIIFSLLMWVAKR